MILPHACSRVAVGSAVACLAGLVLAAVGRAQSPDPKLLPALNSQSVQLMPNESFQFQVGRSECCWVFKPTSSPVAWSIEPARDVSIDARTGLVTVAKTAVPGTKFSVRAYVPDAHATVVAVVTVYTRATHPLVGVWGQSGWKPCQPIAQMTAANADPPIQELVFQADGTFSVTWQPFEVYKDYWGQYRYSTASRVLDLQIEHGNFVPKDFAGHGTAAVSGDTLTLRDVRLGTRQATARPAMCELWFVRRA